MAMSEVAALRLTISAENTSHAVLERLATALDAIQTALERITKVGADAGDALKGIGEAAAPAAEVNKAAAGIAASLGEIDKAAPDAAAGLGDVSKAATDVAVGLSKVEKAGAPAATAIGDVAKAADKIATTTPSTDEALAATSGALSTAAKEADGAAAAFDRVAAAGAAAGAGGAGGAGGGAVEAAAAGAGATGGPGEMVATDVALKDAGNAARELGMRLLTVGAVAGAAGGIAVDMGIKFQSAMELIHTQAGASQAEVQAMSKAVLQLAGTVPYGPAALSAALYHLESIGLRGKAALDALTVAAKGAATGGANLEDVTNALAAAMVSHINGVQNLNQAMGILNAIVGSGNMRMQDLAAAMSSGMLPAAKAAGLSITDVGAALATLTDAGVPAQEAATRLRMTFSLLSAPTKQATTELASIGMSQLQLAQDMREHGLIYALQDLETHLTRTGLSAEAQGEVIARSFGGGKSSATIITLLENLDRMRTKFQLITDGANSFGADWKAAQATAAVSFGKMLSSLEAMGIELGDQLMPVATKVFRAVSSVASAFGKLPPGTIKLIADAILGLTAALVPLGLALIGVGTAAKVAEAADKLAPVFGAITSPVGLVVVAIAALATGIILLVTHWRQVNDWMKSNVPGVWNAVATAVRTVEGLVKSVLPGIERTVLQVWNAIASDTRSHWGEIQQVIEFVGKLLTVQVKLWETEFRIAWTLLSSIVTGAWAGIVKTLSGAFQVVEGVIKLAFTIIETLVNVGLDIVTGHWSKAWTDLTAGAGAAWKDIEQIVTGAIQTIEGAISAFTGAIGGVISGIEKLIGQGQKAQTAASTAAKAAQTASSTATPGGVTPAKVPKLAAGGIVTQPTLALVGEAGPEAVVPLGNANATGAGVRPLATGGMGGDVYNITVMASGNVTKNENQLADAIARRIYQRAKLGRVKMA